MSTAKPRGLHRLHEAGEPGPAGREARLHLLRGAGQPDHADVDPPLYSAEQRVLKEAENHVALLGPHFAYYNFCRIHQSLRVTPAMTAGVTTRVWSIEELVALLPQATSGGKRGPYRKGNSN